MTPVFMHSHRARLAGLLAGLALAACSTKPPIPDWQMNAHGAAQKAVEAYLSGQNRVATLEFGRARQETARTGQPTLMARVVLLECAARVASLQFEPCTAFEPLRPDTEPAERAYADYLAGQLAPQYAALLPPTQRAAAVVAAGGAAPVLAAIPDALSRLVAAGVLLQTGRADPATLALAVDTASEQGWRRPLLAWLMAQAEWAEKAGAVEEAARLRRRMALVEQGGAP